MKPRTFLSDVPPPHEPVIDPIYWDSAVDTSGMKRAVLPKRIQRKRTKGWRMPEGAVYVGRPSRWGNPFAVRKYGRRRAVEYFRAFATGEIVLDKAMPDYRAGEKRLYGEGPATYFLGEQAAIFLKGHDLACWCPINQPCHAAVLLELANR